MGGNLKPVLLLFGLMTLDEFLSLSEPASQRSYEDQIRSTETLSTVADTLSTYSPEASYY